MNRLLYVFFGLAALLFNGVVWASVPPSAPIIVKTIPTIPSTDDPSEILEHLVSVPENDINLLWSILVIDKYINPETDVEKTYRHVEGMGRTVAKMAGDKATDLEKIAAIRTYIYTAGPWNNHQPFSYDFLNPQGRLAVHKTLDYYIGNKKGNCVSMPILFLVLSEQLGVDVSLITAPTHLQIRYTDPKTGKSINLETTSGANPNRPEWLRTQIPPWTDRAVNSDMYLKTLTKQQMVAEMGTTMLQQLYTEDKNYHENIEVALVILNKYPQADIPLLHIMHSAQKIIETDYISKYADLSIMPPNEQMSAISLMEMADLAHQRLFELGYNFPKRAAPPQSPRPQQIMPSTLNMPTIMTPTFQTPSLQNPAPQMSNPFPLNPNTASPYIGQERR